MLFSRGIERLGVCLRLYSSSFFLEFLFFGFRVYSSRGFVLVFRVFFFKFWEDVRLVDGFGVGVVAVVVVLGEASWVLLFFF